MTIGRRRHALAIGPDKFNRPIVYIITGNRETERRLRAAALTAGYPEAIINVERISPVLAPLGVGDQGSWFALVHAVAVPLDKPAVEAYYRVTADHPLQDDPEPVPILRVRGTGHTEMPLYPSLKKLREAILDTYADLHAMPLDSKITQETLLPGDHDAIAEKPFVGLQRAVDVFGASRDNVSITSYPNFRLRDDLDAADMNITWRSYVEPATNVGPDDNELLYDRAIYFGPYFDQQ